MELNQTETEKGSGSLFCFGARLMRRLWLYIQNATEGAPIIKLQAYNMLFLCFHSPNSKLAKPEQANNPDFGLPAPSQPRSKAKFQQKILTSPNGVRRDPLH